MKKYMPIIKDGIVLVLVSTVFVVLCNQLFKGLKKTVDTDPIVTAVVQGKLEPIQEILSQKGFEANKGNHATLDEYLKERANQRDEFGRTPLMRIAYINMADAKAVLETDKKRTALADFVTANGADVNAADNDGWTPLHWAAWSGMPELVAKLLERSANPTLADKLGKTPLMIAAMRGHLAVVKVLLEKGADRMSRDQAGKGAVEFAQDGQTQYRDKAEAYREIIQLLGQQSPS